jgi:hypothetical protein
VKRHLSVLLALGLLAGSAYALPAGRPAPRTVPAMAKHTTHHIRVSVRARGLLYPGVRRRLLVRMTNPNRRDVVVRSITATVKDAPRDCPGGSVSLSGYRGGPLRLPPRGKAKVRLAVRMATSAPDGCQGAALRLAVHAQARIARRR